MFIKRGEAIAVKPSDVRTLESLGSDLDLDIDNRMRKLAQTLKKIAPKASDFLYFTCVMMHAAEASLLDENGELKKLANGQPVNATWEPVGDGFRWVCNDPSLRPYKNKNCFIAGTPILMADGTSKNIEDIKIGDEVVTHKNRVRKVVNTMCTDHSGDVYTFKPKFLPKITATGEHPFLIKDLDYGFVWRNADCLNVGSLLVSHKNNDYFVQEIETINITEFEGKVYNFEVEEDHSYVAGGLVVHNCDIFPSSELKIAHKKWIGKPLCLDHKSSSVDMVRGVIVDTFYDEKKMRVVALCALDKVNYPDLARKVATGYACDVSMGTAVGKAVCTECFRVARVASDFCDHMKTRNLYGEVNFELSPIELSIVVTGADPNAKIKQIVAHDLSETSAALKAIEDYVNNKLSLASSDEADGGKDALEEIKKQVENIAERLGKIENVLSKMDSGNAEDVTLPNSNFALQAASTPRWASASGVNIVLSDLQQAILGQRTKLASLIERFNEDTMTSKKAYYQGTEDPTKSYPVDPGWKAREQNKNLVGAPPFPGVGPVDGSYPGDEALKKSLKRAEVEERDALRKAALESYKRSLESKAYVQGTEEPKTYPVDPGWKAREQNKNLVGAPPFPGVGDPSKPYPGDAELKEKLSRAGLSAKFKKVSHNGVLNKAASRWEVYAGDQIVLSATVNDISGGKVNLFYDKIATAEFGKNIIGRIQKEGFESVRAELTKTAQDMPAPAAPAAPSAPAAPAPTAPPAPGADMAPSDGGTAEGQADNILADVQETYEKLGNLLSDLAEVVGPLKNDAENMEGVQPAAPVDFENAAAGQKTASLESMRKALNGWLIKEAVDTVAKLKSHAEELEYVRKIASKKYASFNDGHRKRFDKLSASSITDAEATMEKTAELLSAVVEYAQGSATMVKNASNESGDENDVYDPAKPDYDRSRVEGIMDRFDPENIGAYDNDIDRDEIVAELSELYGLQDEYEDEAGADDDSETMAALDALLADDEEDTYDAADASDEEDAADAYDDAKVDEEEDCGDAKVVTTNGQTIEVPGIKEIKAYDLGTKQGRAAYRASKLAAAKGKDIFEDSHDGGVNPNGTKGDLATIETIHEVHDAMMANVSVKAKKQAAEIAKLVANGELAKSDVDGLVAHGVDAEAVKYWKSYFAEAGDAESKEFAAELTKGKSENAKKAEIDAYKVKLKRAYDLSREMSDKGLIEPSQVDKQADDILTWDDAAFQSVASFVSRQASRVKTASVVPQVGLANVNQITVDNGGGADIASFLAQRWNNKIIGGR